MKGTISRVLFPKIDLGNDGHLSWALIAQGLKRPYPSRLPSRFYPIGKRFEWAFLIPCLRQGKRDLFGLAPGGVYRSILIAQDNGELLPRLFTLIPPLAGRYLFCGTFLIPKSIHSDFGTVRVTDHPALWSSDFPPLINPKVDLRGATICSPSLNPLSPF